MKHLTDAILRIAISELPSTFDFHDLLRLILKRFPCEYALDLGETRGVDPITTLHSRIGARIAGLGFKDLEKAGRLQSASVRAEKSICQAWRKRQ